MMKRTLAFATILLFLANTSSAQLMTFGFIKNCMTYERTTVTDELKKKQFFIADRSIDIVNNKLMEGATYYSNNKDRDMSKGEIGVLSQINGSKKITEISFINGKTDYSKNHTDVHNQMISFFKNEETFKSPKYKTDVLKYERDKNYYYVFRNNNVPTIVIANYKIDADYFEYVK